MAKTVELIASAFAVLHYENQDANDHTSNPANVHLHDSLYLKFNMPSDGTQFKKVYTEGGSGVGAPNLMFVAALGGNILISDTTEQAFSVGVLPDSFSPDTITYRDRFSDIQNIGYVDINNKFIYEHNNSGAWTTPLESANFIKSVKTGIELACLAANTSAGYKITTSGNAPQLYFSVDESETCGLEIVSVSPTAGVAAAAADNVFSWVYRDPQTCLADLSPVSTVFRWRATDGSFLSGITVEDNANTLTVPAGTFEGHDEIEWWVEITANSGAVTKSTPVTLSTVDVLSTATAISPVGIAVDASRDTLFRWRHNSATGTEQTAAFLIFGEVQNLTTSNMKYSHQVVGPQQEWTCPAGTLTANIKYWRVVTCNSDGTSGEWSDPARIIIISAPSKPAIWVESMEPRPKIRWQAADQLAYQVEVDGVLSGGTHYGSDQTWKSPDYLPDGEHTIGVRVQNQYGLWSEWSTTIIQVENIPAYAITLTVAASDVAVLSWNNLENHNDFFLVYRDGKLIAKTRELQYTDKMSIGTVTYQVRGCYDPYWVDGFGDLQEQTTNYTMSNAVTVEISTGKVAMLYGVDSDISLTLAHCGLDNQSIQKAVSRDIRYYFMYGSEFPHAERSEFVTQKIGGTAVFLLDENKAEFESMIGELVCLKTQTGEMITGYLNEVSDVSLPSPAKSVVNFSIQQIDRTEVIDIDA